MKNDSKKFGALLKSLRIDKNFSLREVCRLVGYDPSNWSKIERGIISPPSDIMVLTKWLKILGINKDNSKYNEFIDNANIAQGIIPEDILSQENSAEYLPAVFRTLRNEKPDKKDIDKLIKLIRGA
jgi:transcriptional regulator with XRE-family HTH domain